MTSAVTDSGKLCTTNIFPDVTFDLNEKWWSEGGKGKESSLNTNSTKLETVFGGQETMQQPAVC